MEYFIPTKEDIKIGYQCEFLDVNQDIWFNKIININSLNRAISFGLDNNWVRVPYLTKEQIEAEGWDENGNKGEFHVERIVILEDNKEPNYSIVITRAGINKHICLYSGECKDINTFRYICKLLKIN